MRVFLDAGHGGRDPGAVGNGLQEKDVVLPITIKIGEILGQNDIVVGYSRTSDIAVDLRKRSEMANTWGADVLVSIHANSFQDNAVRGVEFYYQPGDEEGLELARAIQQSMVQSNLFSQDRGLKAANLSVLRETKMPATLVELGFISNSYDAKILATKQNEIAHAVAGGILSCAGISAEHWAEKHFKSLNHKGICIHERRFDDNIKRGEVFALIDRMTDKEG